MTTRKLGIGVSYAIWSGLATTLITLVGRLYFGETFTLSKLIGIGMIMGGVALINLAQTSP